MTNSDLLELGYPLRANLQRAMSQGRLPVWASDSYGGWPHLAEGQIGALSPLSWFGGTPGRSLSLSMLAALVLAGLSAYRLGRAMGLSRPAAFVAGTTWPLSGTCLSHLTHFNILEAMALAPLGLAYVEESCRPGKAWRLVFTAPVVVHAWLAGHPQMAFYTVLAMGALLLSRCLPLWRRDHRPGLAHLGWLCVAGALALAILAPLLVHTKDLVDASIRAGRLTDEQVGLGSLPPRLIARWVVPGFGGAFGTLTTLPEDGVYIWTHAGPLAVVALLAMLWAARRRRVLVRALSLLLVAVLFACGHYTPAFRGFLAVPGVAKFRFMSRMLFFAELALALMLGWAVQETMRRTGRRLAVGAVVVVHLVGLMAVAWPALPTVPASRFPPASPTAEFLQGQPAGRLFCFYSQDAWVESFIRAEGWRGTLDPYFHYFSTLNSNLFTLYDLTSAQGYTAIPILGLQLLVDRPVSREIDLKHRPVTLAPQVLAALRVMAVRWITTTRPFTNPECKLAFRTQFPWDGFQVMLYELTTATPRARVVGAAEPGHDEGAEIQVLSRPGYDPTHVTLVRGLERAEGSPGVAGTARVVLDDDTGLVVDAHADRDAWLVVADLHFPGWRAHVDGVEVPLHRADVVYRAVRLPRGDHRVIMTYEVRHWRPLVGLMALGVVLLAAIAWRGGR